MPLWYNFCCFHSVDVYKRQAAPEPANDMYEYVKKKIAELGIPVASGEFGADMKVSLENDGPVTIILER